MPMLITHGLHFEQQGTGIPFKEELYLVYESQLGASLPESTFSDTMLVARN
jgi:hypothetical protein